MRITDGNLSGAQASETGQAQETQRLESGGGKQAAGRPDTAGDRVEFSGALARLSKTMDTSQSQRSRRVQALAGQYQSGQYRPNSAATSRAMVNEMLAAGKT